jgi:hypothetical protein
MTTIWTIADAIATELADSDDLSVKLNPGVSALLEVDLQDLNVLHVDVTPVNSPSTYEAHTQQEVSVDLQVDIAVRKRFDRTMSTDGPAEVSDRHVRTMCSLLDEIAKFFHLQRFDEFGDALLQSASVYQWFSRDDLQQNGQYTGVVRLTFESIESV